MKRTFRYQPPVLIDMRNGGTCGEFATCSTGSSKGYCTGGSCTENAICQTGTQVESCRSGSSACGCNSCCSDGTGYTYDLRNGFPWIGGCWCMSGGQARGTCQSGNGAGSTCNTGDIPSIGDWGC